ncbi:hypothetical protein COV18_07500 [Candidatus Woesearchaeota archaeon CG10_big_fil_rev_8_21_14_0_10_37_12]|nr:MAG: hypothetical protein COV18_07500 [Candidatus Woesearchaeota archaeon CG10_big_fil_rev_8_21_14_0_10_37_12]
MATKKRRETELATALVKLKISKNKAEAQKKTKKILAEDKRAINTIIQSLKKSAKEQRLRAKKIQRKTDKNRKVLSKNAQKISKDVQKNIAAANKVAATTKQFKEKLKVDSTKHGLCRGDLLEAKVKIDKLMTAIEDTKYIIEEAAKIQKPEKKSKK